jgi:hypothetical protein
MRRIQIYLDEGRYHWLEISDPLIQYLLEEPATQAAGGTDGSSVQTLDRDIYG